MKTLVLYYSWSGHTQRLAHKLAREQGAELCEVKDETRPGTLCAYTLGSLAARRQAAWPIRPLGKALEEFDRLILMAPVWWGFPAPAFNSVAAALPAEKDVEVVLVSASGGSAARQKVTALLEAQGCRISRWQDVRSTDVPK